jgi:hypothetical protein
VSSGSPAIEIDDWPDLNPLREVRSPVNAATTSGPSDAGRPATSDPEGHFKVLSVNQVLKQDWRNYSY